MTPTRPSFAPTPQMVADLRLINAGGGDALPTIRIGRLVALGCALADWGAVDRAPITIGYKNAALTAVGAALLGTTFGTR